MINSNKKNTYQRKYYILVASSRELIDKDEGDLWDSGFVMDSSSVAVCYAGKPLDPSTVYYWKVAIEDSHGKKSDFSEAKGFVTAAELDDYTSVLPLEKQIQQPENLVIKGNSVIADFGKDAFSQIFIRLNSFLGRDTVMLHFGEDTLGGLINPKPYGEVRYKRMRLNLKKGYCNYNIIFEPNRQNTDPNVNNGAVPVLMPNYIGEVLPFRYVQIDNYNGRLQYSNIVRHVVTYPFDDNASKFVSSDTILNQVWELCKYTMKATSFAGSFVDGDRERITYEGDSYVNQLSYFAVSDQYSIARNTLERLMYHATWPTEWILLSLSIAYNDYLYTGDISFLKKYYENLKMRTLWSFRDKYINLLYSGKKIGEPYLMKRLNTPSLCLSDMIDWPESEQDKYEIGECNTYVNALYYNALKVFAKIAAALHNKYDEEQFNNLAEQTRVAINKHLCSPNKLYVDGIGSQHSSLHANIMPLAAGMVEDSCRAAVMDFIKKRGMACSPFNAQFLLEGIFDAGDADYGLRVLTDTTFRSWYQMIRRGCTMTSEAWNDSAKCNLDWNHAWSAAPANVISHKVMGIEPVAPGFARVRIAPQIASLSHARIKHPTPRGAIVLEIKQDSPTKVRVLVEIPANMTADVVLPGEPTKTVGSGEWKFVYNPQIK
ncbi:MAG: alpha-L-rhamnosidase [Bacteroidales bacterium]|nr:alpha-L-rhamnosidase [Bacteroidales bacterium]